MELTKTDLHFVVSRIPRDVRNLLKKHRPLFLAGGFIRATIAGEAVNDLDIFGASKEALFDAAASLAADRHGRMHKTDNAYTVLAHPRKPVQFIHRWMFDQAAPLCESFDFTIARAVIWWDGEAWRSVTGGGFYPDLAARRLVYCAPARNEDAGGSMLRVRKFLKAGYNIQAGSLGAVIARLMSGINSSPLADNSEAGLARTITGLLREVDPLAVIDGIEPIDEHQVEGIAQ